MVRVTLLRQFGDGDRFPRLRKRFKAQLRKELYFVQKHGIDDHAEMIGQTPHRAANRIMGQFHYARSVEPEFTAKLARLYPVAYRTLIPEKTDDRIERVQRYRAEFLREVLSAPSGNLPMYVPTTELGPA